METDNDELDQEVVEEARSMGWVPEDEFKGKKENWVPADEYVERGRHIIPIMQANNKRMRQELLTSQSKVGTLSKQVETLNATIGEITSRMAKDQRAKLKDQKRELTRQISDARKDDNPDLEFQLVESLEEVKKQEEELEEEIREQEKNKKSPPANDKNGNSGYTPEMNEWLKANPWYGQDKKKTKAYERLAEDLRDEGETAIGAEFFAILDEKFEELYGDDGTPTKSTKRTPANKAESGGHSRSAGGSGGGKSFLSLPKEAQNACLEFADALVGEGKTFKTLDDWKKHYTTEYFASGEE